MQRATNNQAVGFLTDREGGRQRSDARRDGRAPAFTLRAYTLTLAGVAALACTLTAGAAEWQRAEEIGAVAEAFVTKNFARRDTRLEPQAGYLDPRLKLPRCDVPLTAFVRDGTRLTARTIVGVRCAGSRPWKVYVPVDVAVRDRVYVLRRSLPKGHVVTEADVALESRDVARLRNGYFTEASALAGLRLKYPVSAGSVLKPSMLAAEILIRRGQSVTLVAQSEALSIEMAGKALSDGAMNQRIRVENTNSGRVVEGLVRSPEHVEILVQ